MEAKFDFPHKLHLQKGFILEQGEKESSSQQTHFFSSFPRLYSADYKHYLHKSERLSESCGLVSVELRQCIHDVPIEQHLITRLGNDTSLKGSH